jgi:hypothetical protein
MMDRSTRSFGLLAGNAWTHNKNLSCAPVPRSAALVHGVWLSVLSLLFIDSLVDWRVSMLLSAYLAAFLGAWTHLL